MESKEKGNATMVLLVVLVVVALFTAGYYVKYKHDQKKPSPNTPVLRDAGSSSSASQALSSGTDNSSLNSDLSNINGGLNQSNQSLQDANNALDGQQPTISE